jgi:hypothetical protein
MQKSQKSIKVRNKSEDYSAKQDPNLEFLEALHQ